MKFESTLKSKYNLGYSLTIKYKRSNRKITRIQVDELSSVAQGESIIQSDPELKDRTVIYIKWMGLLKRNILKIKHVVTYTQTTL